MNKYMFSWKSFLTTLYIFIPLFLITSVALWIFCIFEVNKQKENIYTRTSHVINLQKTSIANNFKMIVNDLIFFANYSHVKEMLNNNNLQNSELQKDLSLFSRGAKIYDQIRILDSSGMEKIRINYNKANGIEIVKEDKLQNKKNRYYFTDTYCLNEGEIFVSPLDLNIEHGKIEDPIKPMIRFGTPIFDNKGTKRGIIIFNYLAEYLINDIKELIKKSPGKFQMLNSDGYTIINNYSPEFEWTFMYPEKKDFSIKNNNMKLWDIFIKEEEKQFLYKKDLYTYSTIHPLFEGWKSSTGSSSAYSPSVATKEAKDYFWKILIVLPNEYFRTEFQRIIYRYISLTLLSFIVLIIFAFNLAKAIHKEKLALIELNKININLEQTVEKRTKELVITSKVFQSLVETTVDHFDQDFFDNLVEKLCTILKCDCAIVGKIGNSNCLNVISMNLNGNIINRSNYSIENFPFRKLIEERFSLYSEKAPISFPNDDFLKTLIPEGFVGISITNNDSEVIGVLCAISSKPLILPPNAEQTLKILSSRATAELERMEKENESKELSFMLQQSQKMEALGTLAGGIAHDFNNMLSVILGYTELAFDFIPSDSPLQKYIDNIMEAGYRAKDLVQQILSFSRQSNVSKKVIMPHLIIKEAVKMLQSTIPSSIKVNKNISPDCGNILADPTQLHQIIINLGTNAFHAMEETGGNLSITLQKANSLPSELEERAKNNNEKFIDIVCQDNGQGISEETIGKIFDPFFTTKEKGKGTGMGLSITYGIVKDFNGLITVDSIPGKGTTFHVYLPIVNMDLDKEIAESQNLSGNEKILYVDDEETVSNLAKELLESMGYSVTTANTGTDAINIFSKDPNYFDLIITDQIMPDFTGLTLSKRVLKIRSNVPIILCTGHSTLLNKETMEKHGIKGLISKPITKTIIAKSVRNVLNNI